MKVELLKTEKDILLKPLVDTQYVLIPSKEVSVTVEMEKEGVSSELMVPFNLSDNEQINLVTRSVHKVPNTSCFVRVRGALFDKAASDYVGKIVIEKGAQGTKSFLKDDVLSLGEKTKNHSQPILEIKANDVKASHGATTGRVGEKEVFYLMSRGLSGEEAKEVLVEGFFEALLSRISDDKIREQVKEKIYV